ncbi:MAG TPA: FixH family protein [Armatimonadota bacterium]|nr:FixH family protein [Armatimonadota bacterium]
MNRRFSKLTLPLAAGLALAALPAAMAGAAPPATGANMAGMQMESSPAGAASVALSVTVRPNPPVMGANTLDILASNGATGKPVTGMKLQSTVRMISMDMGTTHPAVKDLGGGKYRTVVTFSMNGPWRVTLAGNGSAGKVSQSFNFAVGSPEPWTQPKGGGKKTDQPAMSAPTGFAETGAHDTMSGMTETAANSLSDMGVPVLQPERVFTVTGGQDWKATSGFGHNAPMVKMMNLMMVEGAGMGKMKMAPMKLNFGPENFAVSASSPASSVPASGDAAVDASSLKITAVLPQPKVGDNDLNIIVTDAKGAPVTGATVSTSVAMTSMDMGTTHPAAKEMGGGHYSASVNFSMAGPWRVEVNVATPGQTPVTHSFEFEPK